MDNVIPFPSKKPQQQQAPQSTDEKMCANSWHIPSRANPRVCRDCRAWPLKP